MSEAIVIRHLTKSYHEKKVLEDFSLSINKGQITALMAPSGAGKTTLLRLLTGLETPDAGSIEGLAGLRLSCVFQEDRLCNNLGIVSNIRLAAGKGLSDETIAHALKALGLWETDAPPAPARRSFSFLRNKKPPFPELALRPVRELSGGQRRRAALLRSLLVPWDLLLLDEPFQGLDPEARQAAMSYILSCFRQQPGRTVLLITHDREEAEALAERILTLTP